MSSTPAHDLELLLAAARRGSRVALGQLLDAFRPHLLQAAQREIPADLQGKQGASDLVQDSLAEAVQDFPRFAGCTEAELIAWLRQILRNNLLTFIHSYRETGKRDVHREISLDGPESGGLARRLSSDSTSPSGKVMKREEAEAMQQALQRLPEDYQRVILLHHRDGLPFPEVARLMGKTEAAVRRLWARAIQRWRQEVEQRNGPS